MSARHAAPDAGRPGERLVRVGAGLFAVGVLGVLAVLVPFLLGNDDAPLWTTLTASLLPVGLAVALVGLLRGARSTRREHRRARKAQRRADRARRRAERRSG